MKGQRTEGMSVYWCGASCCCCYLHPPPTAPHCQLTLPAVIGSLHYKGHWPRMRSPCLATFLFFATNKHTNTCTHTHFFFPFVVPKTQQGKNPWIPGEKNSCIWIRSYPSDWCVSNMIYWLKPQLLWGSRHMKVKSSWITSQMSKCLCNSALFKWIVYERVTETFPLLCCSNKINISNRGLVQQRFKTN